MHMNRQSIKASLKALRDTYNTAAKGTRKASIQPIDDKVRDLTKNEL